jgi:hypothetical protein
VSEALYLEESLEAIVKTTMDALAATGAALVLEDGAIAWPEGTANTHAIRQPLRWRGRQIGELVADRATPFTDQDRELLASIAQQAAVALEHGRAVMRGCSPRRSTTGSRTTCRRSASLLRLRPVTPRTIDPRKALEDSRPTRILAIAAVHEVLTEQRDEDVDLASSCSDRLRAMLVQGRPATAGHAGDGRAEPRSRSRATVRRRSRSCSRELLGNAFEHGGAHGLDRPPRGSTARSCSSSPDDGAGIPGPKRRDRYLDRARASCGTSSAGARVDGRRGGTRAEVRFQP